MVGVLLVREVVGGADIIGQEGEEREGRGQRMRRGGANER